MRLCVHRSRVSRHRVDSANTTSQGTDNDGSGRCRGLARADPASTRCEGRCMSRSIADWRNPASRESPTSAAILTSDCDVPAPHGSVLPAAVAQRDSQAGRGCGASRSSADRASGGILPPAPAADRRRSTRRPPPRCRRVEQRYRRRPCAVSPPDANSATNRLPRKAKGPILS